MIKKLDKLILRAFIGPFLATFLIAIFVLILQFFWLWIDDFVGKGIDMATLGKVILYVAGQWVPIALPLAMLISTIMTFGNLGESYELVAIKSAGISLRRFMRPILVFSLLITGVAFLFNNNVIPIVNLRLNKLKYEIVYTKPAFDIKPGVFYDKIDGYVIKLGSKEADGQGIGDIVIYERGNYLQDNLIVADSGVMRVSADKRFLEFDLKNGTRYEERGMRNTTNTELTRVTFEQYKKSFDLSSFNMVQSNDSMFKDNYRMLSIRQLNVFYDSLARKADTMAQRLRKNYTGSLRFAAWLQDSPAVQQPQPYAGKLGTWADVVPDSACQSTNDMALSRVSSARSSYELMYNDYAGLQRDLRHYAFGVQQKFSLSFACFVMFLVGAPLGSIIRKGGLGTPLVFAVIFFAIFHLLTTTGDKLTKEGVLPIFAGTWLASLVLTPVGIFLVYKAMRDSQLFNKEFYYRALKGLRERLLRKTKRNAQGGAPL
ncbi:MAG TPA: LptF/LptG family permease [Phnomibacter sp.]|nr:LptF/LptG family permease [Phnomibacter sp.]